MKSKKYSITKELAFITIGTIILSCAYGIFLIPNKIAPVGFSGIAALINYATCLPAGTMSLVLNIPVLIIACECSGIICSQQRFMRRSCLRAAYNVRL
jgi:uncharacterized membrane-anchored protein YitT (DUF2179 family)